MKKWTKMKTRIRIRIIHLLFFRLRKKSILKTSEYRLVTQGTFNYLWRTGEISLIGSNLYLIKNDFSTLYFPSFKFKNRRICFMK